jgi:molybdopterin-guanine dinucleotide biosynthesis protein A
MGRDKAAIAVHGVTLLEGAVALLDSLGLRVWVSVNPDQAGDELRRRFRLLPDPGPGLGPAGGLLAAHGLEPDAAWLVLACDMPGLDRESLALLVAARDAHRGAVAWRSPVDGRPEPLCAIWEPATLARLAAQARSNAAGGSAVSPRALLEAADTVLLAHPRPAVLASLNTPEELQLYQEETHGPEP